MNNTTPIHSNSNARKIGRKINVWRHARMWNVLPNGCSTRRADTGGRGTSPDVILANAELDPDLCNFWIEDYGVDGGSDHFALLLEIDSGDGLKEEVRQIGTHDEPSWSSTLTNGTSSWAMSLDRLSMLI